MKILVAVEGTADFRHVCTLFDRWLSENVEWFDPAHPSLCREFIGVEPGREYVALKTLPKRRKKLCRGGFGAPHPSRDAGMIHDLRLILKKQKLEPDLVLWLRDSDGDKERARLANDYVTEKAERERFIVGYPSQVIEAWILAGWYAAPGSIEDAEAEKKIRTEANLRIPRDAHRFGHKDIAGGAKWAVKILFSNHELQASALLRAWEFREEEEVRACGLGAFRRELNNHVGLRRALGLPRLPLHAGGR